MKVLHVPFCFYPGPVGGTEVYVEGLSRELQRLGIACVVAAPSDQDDAYEHRGIPVRRYVIDSQPQALRELYGQGDVRAANGFKRILAIERPDIVHLHAFTRGVSLRAVRMAKAQGIPVVFTYHTPAVSCQRGTMMQWGIKPCRGIMDLHTCARCTLHGLFQRTLGSMQTRSGLRDIPIKVLGHAVGSLPPAFGARLGQFDLEGGHWTALRMTELHQLRHATVRSLFAEVDHVIAVCQWVWDVLISNGVPPHKISLCRQGVMEGAESGEPNPERFSTKPHSPLQIAFVGRLDPTKGVDILIQSLRLIPDAQLRLVIYGVAQGEEGRDYETRLRHLAAPDKRIEFHAPVPSSKITSTLRDYDLLAAPSQCLETGPLVVLEAFAAGTAVVGSRIGGIAELVRDGFDGVLLEAANIREWANAVHRLSEDRNLVNYLRRNIISPRKSSTVANEMAVLYERVLSRSRHRRASPVSIPD